MCIIPSRMFFNWPPICTPTLTNPLPPSPLPPTHKMFIRHIEWVQDTVTATPEWGAIGDWDVSGVGDFSFAFSNHRNKVGGTSVFGGNRKAATFVSTDISKWITTSVTSLAFTFQGASKMNADLSKWSVDKVTTLHYTFQSASKFAGSGLNSWITTSVTSLHRTFQNAGEMNSDLSKWNVAKVRALP